jgi:hypothetical protein
LLRRYKILNWNQFFYNQLENNSQIPPLLKGRCEKIVPFAKGGQGCRAGTGSEGQRPEASKVLQRYLFKLTADDEKLRNMLAIYRLLLPLPSQMIAFIKLWRYLCPTNP